MFSFNSIFLCGWRAPALLPIQEIWVQSHAPSYFYWASICPNSSEKVKNPSGW